MSQYEVRIIKEGYSHWLSPSTLRADGTISLIKGRKNIIVDTGSPWDTMELLSGIGKEHLDPKDISVVVCTHGHSDHNGNNNLFPDALFISGQEISQGDLYTVHDFSAEPYQIDEDVTVISTPGHTCSDISVIITTGIGAIAIVGDLFEKEEDLMDENIWKKTSEHPELQKKNRQVILKMADFIVPGHGKMFRNLQKESTS